MGPKTEKDLLPKVSRQKRGAESREVSRVTIPQFYVKGRGVGSEREKGRGRG